MKDPCDKTFEFGADESKKVLKSQPFCVRTENGMYLIILSKFSRDLRDLSLFIRVSTRQKIKKFNETVRKAFEKETMIQ